MDHRLKELRLAAHLTQEELAELVGSTKGQIANLESGTRGMTLTWLRRLARALGVRAADLLTEQDNPRRCDELEWGVVQQLRCVRQEDRARIAQAVQLLTERPASTVKVA
jgi:transcriptional regulator with XRE-family HTH domain